MPKTTKMLNEEPKSQNETTEEQKPVPETPIETRVRKKVRRRKVKSSSEPETETATAEPEWYMGIKDRLAEFEETQQQFSNSKKDVKGISDLERLKEMKTAAENKSERLLILRGETEQCYEKMMADTGNEDKKSEAETYYKSCNSKAEICSNLYDELIKSIDSRINKIEEKQAKKETIVKRFRAMKKETPMIMLIKRVRLFQKNPGYEGKAKGLDKVGEVLTKISDASLGEGNLEKIEKIYDFSDESYHAVNDTSSFVRTLQGKSPKEYSIGKYFEIVTGAKEIANLIMEIVDYFRERNITTEDGKFDGLVSIVTKGIKKTADIGEKILEKFSNIPIIGGVIGLIKNAINFFAEGYTFYMSQKRMERIRGEKKKLKEKMLKRQLRTPYRTEKPEDNPYAFMSKVKGSAHVNKEMLGDRETRGITGSGSVARQVMKQNSAIKNEEYYKAKTTETVEQYDEMKEVVYKNKNVRSAAIKAIIQEGLSTVGNIASFFSGAGTIIQSGLNAVNSLGNVGYTFGSGVWDKIKSKINSKRSSENKTKFRRKYAEHIYDNLAEVAEYMDENGEFSVDSITPDQAKGLEKSYDYAENMLATLAADMPALIKAKSESELLEKMSSAFSREG